MLKTERLKCTFVCFQLQNVWFQHDGAPEHKTSSMKQYLVEEFGEQIIGHCGFEEWLPRSPDVTPMDFLLWGYLKQQVYATLLPTLQDLQHRITVRSIQFLRLRAKTANQR
ncbi:hypothetical protein AVEN_120120-1 [Araneus ventricosus]|uniref:Tc1-like transposase DDE domain-containing protein n=1 Tax=Araneus ventricosus TaxID=182803 RepID=A0A4Y2LVA9_ARAVE|nr:hypothetical protein AVEN_120120-1 [Araneus ventricosus]